MDESKLKQTALTKLNASRKPDKPRYIMRAMVSLEETPNIETRSSPEN